MEKKATRVSVVVPVYNEEKDLARNIPVLHKFLKDNFTNYAWEVVIADNGPSKDRTPQVAHDLVGKYKGVRYLSIPRPGRGRALKEAWLSSKRDIRCYMDVDLSSDLSYFRKLIEAIENGADIAIGSRLKKGAKVYGRTLTREVMSRGYNLLIRLLFFTGFCDAQCGFKAISGQVASRLLSVVEDKAWFFDSELLIIADRAGYRIEEIPIVWRDDPASTVKVAKTAWGDIKGLVRLWFTRPWTKLKIKN